MDYAAKKTVGESKYAYLVDHLSPKDVLPMLVAKGLVDNEYHQKLEGRTRRDQVEILLTDIVRCPLPDWFERFTDALDSGNRPHQKIAEELREEYQKVKRESSGQPGPTSASRSSTMPNSPTGSSAVKPPLPSPSAPNRTVKADGTNHQDGLSSTLGQDVNSRPQQGTAQSPPQPSKVAPQGRITWRQCDEGSLDTLSDVSFAILLGNENEYLATLNYYGMGFRIVSENQDYTNDVLGCTYDSDPNEASLTRVGKYFSITINGKTGLICRSASIGSGGRYGALMTTITLLKNAKELGWPLEIIFAVGCAGGRAKPGEALSLGQVIIPKDVVECNRGKVEAGEDGQPKVKRNPEIWHTSESWYESLTDSVLHAGGEDPAISIASGSYEYCSDFVIKDPGVAEELRGLISDPNMIGIEMEGIGIATAIKIMKKLSNDEEVPEFIVVKGISDNADGAAKGAPARMTFFETTYENVYPDDRQVMAALMSLTLVTRAIQMRQEWRRSMQKSIWPWQCTIM